MAGWIIRENQVKYPQNGWFTRENQVKYPQNGLFIRENPIKVHDFGKPFERWRFPYLGVPTKSSILIGW